MKKIYFFFLFLSVASQAQIVTIPDANFKNKLIQLGVDSNNDGNIQTIEASVVETLNVSNSNISSLVGIQSFTVLQSLNCMNNTISSLDVSNMASLVNLSCNNNQMTSLTIQNLPNLNSLYCHENLLTQVDASTTAVERALFSNNPNLTSVNLKNNTLNLCFVLLTGGVDYTCDMFLNCPSLQTVCLDQIDIDTSLFYSNFPQQNATFSTNCTMSVDETSNASNFKLYPNPVENRLYLDLYNLSGTKQLLIFNTLGQLIESRLITSTDNENIDVSKFQKGNYIVTLITEDGKVSKKFTKI